MLVIKIDIVKSKSGFFCMIVAIGTFIPFLGNILVLVMLFMLRAFTKDFEPVAIITQPVVIYSRKTPIQTKPYGADWANVRLTKSTASFTAEEQLRALRGVSRYVSRDVNLIYQKLMSDNMEELRVCSFSMLEKQQNYLHKQISILLKKFKNITKAKQAIIAKQLALLYWELIYRNLSDYEFRNILLKQSYHYASIACEKLPEDATLWILLSRIHLANGKVEDSAQALQRALTLHASPSRVVPYLAEIAYKQQDYATLKKYLEANPSVQYILKMNSIYKFWCKS